MDIRELRKIIIQAVAADDLLMELFVLKGGNALDLIHELEARKSLDMDFSVKDDFENPNLIGVTLKKALEDRFDSAGFVILDYKFSPKPKTGNVNPTWGGYKAEFKILNKTDNKKFEGNDFQRRGASESIADANSKKTFTIEISKYEWVEGAQKAEIDGYVVRVYTLPMIAIEKLRALCQQMEGYLSQKTPSRRARDFFDIYTISQTFPLHLESPETQELVRTIFAAKSVPLGLLSKIKDVHDFHLPDWASVQVSLDRKAAEFKSYFDFVVAEVEKLKPLWEK